METNQTSASSFNGPDKATATAKSAYNEVKGSAQRSSAMLRSELSNLKNNLDALVNRAPNMSDEELSQEHAKLMSQFSSLRHTAKGIANEASRHLNRSVETTSEYVKDRPIQSVAVAVGTGLLLGMLFKRR